MLGMSTPTPTPLYRLIRADQHARDDAGRLVNPDTALPYASLDRHDGEDLAAFAEEFGITGDARDALVLLVTRVHTRTHRANAARLRAAAEANEENARAYSLLATERYREGQIDAGHLALGDAAKFVERARALRSVVL